MQQLIDSHCHLDVAEFDPDRDAVLQRAHAAGVTRIVVPGVESAAWDFQLSLCRAQPGLYPALGLHPVYLKRHREQDLARLQQAIAAERPVAIGEIGLDFAVEGLSQETQLAYFRRQLEIAQQEQLPVILHVRKAHDQVLHLLRRFRLPGGICHAFNGSLQQAEQYRRLGFLLGFGGMLTFERSRRLRMLASEIPLEQIALETDAPDLTVASHRFERNSPEYLPEIAETLAELRGLEVSAVAATTSANVARLLAI